MPTLLLADDNKNIREYCRRELEEEGYRVLVACDGAEAIRMTRSHSPDLVILDISMPGMEGLEAAQRIKAIEPDAPVVFFTSFDDICTQDDRSRNATACVEKREDLAQLKQVVNAALSSRRHHRPFRPGLSPAEPTGSPTP